MKRILKSDLYEALSALNKTTNNTQDYAYDKANGGWKLVRDSGAWQVSKSFHSPPTNLFTKREMYDWMWAYIYGIQDGQKILANT